MNVTRRLTLLAILVGPLLAPAPARGESELRVAGTGTALGTMRALAEPFARAHPGFSLRVYPSVGSSGAMKAVAAGAVDVGLSGRLPRPEESALGIVTVEYARTPFAFVAGPRVDVSGVSAAEVVRIFRGEMVHWPGGERVRLVVRPRGDVDTFLLRAISPEMDAAVEASLAREGMLVAVTNQECNEAVARTPGSIGPSSLTQVLTESLPVKMLAWNGIAPTTESLARGTYPLVKPLYLVLRPSASPAVRRFLSFLGSEEARGILERTGNVPVPVELAE